MRLPSRIDLMNPLSWMDYQQKLAANMLEVWSLGVLVALRTAQSAQK